MLLVLSRLALSRTTSQAKREHAALHGAPLDTDLTVCAPRATVSMHHSHTLHTSTGSFEATDDADASWRTYFLFDVRRCDEAKVRGPDGYDHGLLAEEDRFLHPFVINGDAPVPPHAESCFSVPPSL